MRHKNNFIRLSDINKSRLQNLKNGNSYDDLIGAMLDYFEKTGFSPHYAGPVSEVFDKLKSLENKINSVLIKPSRLLKLQCQVNNLTEFSNGLQNTYQTKSDALKEILNRFLSDIEVNKSVNYYHIPKIVVDNFISQIYKLFFRNLN